MRAATAGLRASSVKRKQESVNREKDKDGRVEMGPLTHQIRTLQILARYSFVC